MRNIKPFHIHKVSKKSIMDSIYPDQIMSVTLEHANLRASKLIETYSQYFADDVKLSWFSVRKDEELYYVLEFYLTVLIN